MSFELEQPFTEEEFNSAVKSMQSCKCSGPDWFPSELKKKMLKN